MRWLIVEDALRDRKGHWLEWVTTFHDGLRRLGDDVVILGDAEVESDIRDALQVQPILPASIWHRMGDGAGPFKRYNRVFVHAWKTWRTMDNYLRRNGEFDAIFVPTVLVHHLLAWSWMIKRTLRNRSTRVLLFFLTAPVKIETGTGKASLDGSPTSKLMIQLLNWIEPEIRSGKVVLGVETKAMQRSMEELTGIPFVYFPQPVSPVELPGSEAADSCVRLEMACFGAARAEKGSDVLQEAIAIHRRRYPASRAGFTIQWIDDFNSGNRTVSKSAELLRDSQVNYLTRYFAQGEYPKHLARTHVMLLPYRQSSYALRGSRVVIEAAVNGVPVVTTSGTTLANVADDFGAGLSCEDGDPVSLAAAIRNVEVRFDELKRQAESRRGAAAEHFSVDTFRDFFLTHGPQSRSHDSTLAERQTAPC